MHEVINDLDRRVVTFYEVCHIEEKFLRLQEKIKATLHCEDAKLASSIILKAGYQNNDIDFAWAFWVQCNMSFSAKIFGGFAFGNEDSCVLNSFNKKEQFTHRYFKRLEETEIFCRDAVELIKMKDSKDTFFYVDPPYVSSDCGHYKGYTMANFTDLLETLSKLEGKFLLSSYPETVLMEYREQHDWNSRDIIQDILAAGHGKKRKQKTECLTWNYELQQTTLFP